MSPTGQKKPVQSSPCPIDAIIDRTIQIHAEQAKERKVREETLRLGPRRRLAKVVNAAIQRELKDKKGSGLNLSRERVAEIAEEAAKHIAKATGLEPLSGKKD